MLASSQMAAATAATHSRFLSAKTAITAIGARTKTASDSQRHTPRLERKKYAAARLTAAPARPTASIVRLFSSAKTATEDDRQGDEHEAKTREPVLFGRTARTSRGRHRHCLPRTAGLVHSLSLRGCRTRASPVRGYS